MRRAHVVAGIVAPLLTLNAAFAEAPAPRWFPVPADARYLTGDSWSDAGVTYRLYGVQSCLRGTRFTNAHGLERDCGEASLAMLVALTRDLRPQCYDAAEQPVPDFLEACEEIQADIKQLKGDSSPMNRFRYVVTMLLLPDIVAAGTVDANGEALRDLTDAALAVRR